MEISKDYTKKQKRDPHLHSPSHVLAEELRLLFNEPHNFRFYLGIATRTDHKVLRRIAGEVMEKKVEKPGALFAYLVKKYNDEQKAKHDSENSKGA